MKQARRFAWLVMLIADAGLRDQIGQNAKAVVEENLGAIERTVEMIVPHLRARGLHVRDKEV